MDNLADGSDNWPIMTRMVPFKSETMDEISRVLGIPQTSPGIGSSIPRVFFSDIASEMGLQEGPTMPQTARAIVESMHLDWHEDFSSEFSPSGGGSTVTRLGLLQVLNAALIFKGMAPLPLPQYISQGDWNPPADWADLKANLETQATQVVARPGSSAFRNEVLSEYENACAITGNKSLEVIEVAHIVPYFGDASDVTQNAIPLRVDLHRLFDQGLLQIEYDISHKEYIVRIHDFVMEYYKDIHNSPIKVPIDPASAPSKKALEVKQSLHKSKWQVI